MDRTRTIYKYTYCEVSKLTPKAFKIKGHFPYVALFDPDGEFVAYVWNTKTFISECVREHREKGTLFNEN